MRELRAPNRDRKSRIQSAIRAWSQLVFDEPTSALDATTEHALFERYISAAHKARRRGAITLLVTHRFSTVAAADIVVVLDHGRIVEAGTHTELIAADGHYAELYELQARGYR